MRRDHRELVKHAREAIGESGLDVDDAVFGRLARRMSYLHGDVTDAALDRRLAAQVGRAKRPLYYLETWRIVQPLPTRILGTRRRGGAGPRSSALAAAMAAAGG